MDGRSSYFRHHYDFRTVLVLLGIKEARAFDGGRHVTVIDLLSWASDPGGDDFWHQQVLQEPDGWMARRGPLAPDSEVACVLWDFMAAVAVLTIQERAIVALKAFGFSQGEIAQALHVRKSLVGETLWGDQERPGIVQKIHRHMNGGDDD
ncbi:MAG: hypothetical protein ACJ76P_12045 [Actinomycetota bacterium]